MIMVGLQQDGSIYTGKIDGIKTMDREVIGKTFSSAGIKCLEFNFMIEMVIEICLRI